MENYILYMHINKVNGKKYIGITSKKANIRWKNGKGYSKQKRFYSSIKHYGWDGFDHIILFDHLPKKTAEEYEEFFISLFQTNDIAKGYNIENGGVIHKLSEEQKEHLRQINLGKKHSKETNRKRAESLKKIPHDWMVGKKHSKETRQKMSMHRMGENNPRAKHKIYQYDLQGNHIGTYSYMGELKEILGRESVDHISDCCLGKRGKAYGYMWSYFLEDKKPYERLWKGGIVHG